MTTPARVLARAATDPWWDAKTLQNQHDSGRKEGAEMGNPVYAISVSTETAPGQTLATPTQGLRTPTEEVADMANRTQETPLVWTCHECKFPIHDGRGSVVASYSSIRDDHANWLPFHYTCQPEDGYEIDIEQLRTKDDVIRWTLHCWPKRWMARSNWRWVLNESASAPGVPA